MVRDRVGDWRLAWRFALAGLVAGLLVIALASTGVTAATFDGGQDQLFPAPSPDPRISFVEIDSRSQLDLGAYPFNNGYHARVINYLASLHPKVILFDLVLDHLTLTDVETLEDTDASLTKAIAAAGNVVLVCTADDWPRGEFSSVAAAVGERGLAVADHTYAGRGVVIRPHVQATCPQNEGDQPAFLLALQISEKILTPPKVSGSEATFGPHRIPLVGDQMLINFTRSSGSACAYVDAFNRSCKHPELITDHIVVVGTKLIDAGDVYSQAVSFTHDSTICSVNRPKCMLG